MNRVRTRNTTPQVTTEPTVRRRHALIRARAKSGSHSVAMRLKCSFPCISM